MNGMRRKTFGESSSQTLATESPGEALDAEAKEAEPLMAKAAPESPALAEQLMEEVCDRGNLERAEASLFVHSARFFNAEEVR